MCQRAADGAHDAAIRAALFFWRSHVATDYEDFRQGGEEKDV